MVLAVVRVGDLEPAIEIPVGVDLTDADSVSLRVKRPDGTFDTRSVDLEAETGKVYLTLDSDDTSEVGVLKCEVVVGWPTEGESTRNQTFPATQTPYQVLVLKVLE